MNVVGVLQLDMTNYKSGTPEDMQLITDYSNADIKTFLTNLFDAYLAPLGLTRGTYHLRLRLFRPCVVDQRGLSGGA